MDIFSSESGRRSTLVIAMMIAAIALLANLTLIVNPGFYSHDEWQRYDFITAHGVHAYLAKYWAIREGKTFASPVRPIGLIQQGLLALWMKSSPWVPHLASAILHSFVAVALFFTATLAGLSRRAAVLAALLFCISPLGVLAIGWTAASFDQWYVLFTLCSIYATFLLMRHGLRAPYMLALLCFSSAAILCKETAMALPGAIAGCGLFTNLINGEKIRWRRIVAASAIAALPIVVYLLIRLPALQRSLAVGTVAAYRPSVHNLLPNILGYVEFPFIPKLEDMISIAYVPAWVRHVALLMHLALLACLAWTGHLKVVVAYLFAYFVFLVPILFIPNTGSHYLYASGIVFSTALAWLLTAARVDRTRFVVVLLAGACVCVTTVHAYVMQAQIYERGICQMHFLNSLDTIKAQQETTQGAVKTIDWQPGTPVYVGSSAIFGREQYRDFRFRSEPQNGSADVGALVMGSDCRVTP